MSGKFEADEVRVYVDNMGRVAFGARTPRAVTAVEETFCGRWIETDDGAPCFRVPGLRIEHAQFERL